MNIYIRYFQEEALVKSLDEAIDFLSSISEIVVTNALVADISDYFSNENTYPKRYKVRPKVYFIMIKTTAETLEEFKANNKNKEQEGMGQSKEEQPVSRKEMKSGQLMQEEFGWYEGTILFKRVIPIPGTGKFQYHDTRFTAFVKTFSGLECYERIVEHLKNRQDVDLRSQFPSAKGQNFMFKFWGSQLPEDISIEE